MPAINACLLSVTLACGKVTVTAGAVLLLFPEVPSVSDVNVAVFVMDPADSASTWMLMSKVPALEKGAFAESHVTRPPVADPSWPHKKGTPAEFLEQSSILADTIPVAFKEVTKEITSCYYEFSFRHPMQNGELYSGFIAGSADKIFESTDMKLQDK